MSLAVLRWMKHHHLVIATSTLVAGAIALALILKPTRSIGPEPELPVPAHLSANARDAIRAKMQRHGQRFGRLASQAIVLDYDGAARTAGEMFDDPGLARPAPGERLEGMVPPRFFVLQDQLRQQSKQLVAAAAGGDAAAFGDAYASLTKSCIACHDVYLRASGP